MREPRALPTRDSDFSTRFTTLTHIRGSNGTRTYINNIKVQKRNEKQNETPGSVQREKRKERANLSVDLKPIVFLLSILLFNVYRQDYT